MSARNLITHLKRTPNYVCSLSGVWLGLDRRTTIKRHVFKSHELHAQKMLHVLISVGNTIKRAFTVI